MAGYLSRMAADAYETDKNTGTGDFTTQLSQSDLFDLELKILDVVVDGSENGFNQSIW